MAIAFNLSNHGATNSGQLTGTFAATWCMWVKRVSDLSNYSTIWAHQGDGGYCALITDGGGDNLRCDCTWATMGGAQSEPNGFHTFGSTWFFVAITKAPGTNHTKLYYAEEGASTLTDHGGPFGDGSSININTSYGTGFGVFPYYNVPAAGAMAYYREWSAALTKAELEAELVSTTAVRTANINREYRFASGDLFADSSGAGHPLTSTPYRNGTGGTFTADPTIAPAGTTVTPAAVAATSAVPAGVTHATAQPAPVAATSGVPSAATSGVPSGVTVTPVGPGAPLLDEDGNPLLDEDGNPLLGEPEPTPVASTSTVGPVVAKATATPNPVAATSAVPTGVTRAAATAAPVAVPATSTVPTPTVTTSASATVTPSPVAATSTVPAVAARPTATPNPVPATSTVPTGVANAYARPNPVAATSLVPTPGVAVPFGAIVRQQVLGGAATKALAGTTLAMAPFTVAGGDDPAVGDVVVVHCVRDHVSADPFTDTLSDGLGNYYHPVRTNTSGTGTAGISHLVFVADIVVAWTGTVTLTWTHPSVTARAFKAEHYKPSEVAHRLRFAAAEMAVGSSTAGIPTATTAAWDDGDCVIGSLAVEGATAVAPTGDADVAGGTWSAVGSIAATGTTGGTANTNVYAASQYKVLDAAGAHTYNPLANASTDSSVIVLRLTEYDPASVAAWGLATDNFSAQTALWDYAGSSGVTAVGGRMRIVSNAFHYGIATPAARSLLSSSAAIQGFPGGGNLGGVNTRRLTLSVTDASGSESALSFSWGPGDGTLSAESAPGGTVDVANSTTAAVNFAAAQTVRIGCAGGVVTWDYSSDGATWTTLWTRTVAQCGWVPDLCYVSVTSGYDAGEGDTPLYLDNFNLAPSADSAAVPAPVAATSAVLLPVRVATAQPAAVAATSAVPTPTHRRSATFGVAPVASTSTVPTAAPAVTGRAVIGAAVHTTSTVGFVTPADVTYGPAAVAATVSRVGDVVVRAGATVDLTLPIPAYSAVAPPTVIVFSADAIATAVTYTRLVPSATHARMEVLPQ